MNVAPLIQKSASSAYAGIRLPFTLAENRLPENSKIRTGLHSALRTIDAKVVPLLSPARPEGGAPVQSDDIETDTEAATEGDTEADREAIVDAVRAQQPDVGELADPELDVAEVQAQLMAKHTIEAREESK